MANVRALQALGRRTGEEGALDALLGERPLLLQLQLENWLHFLGAYGIKVGLLRARGGGTGRLEAHEAHVPVARTARGRVEPRGRGRPAVARRDRGFRQPQHPRNRAASGLRHRQAAGDVPRAV
jgi:hypothetical protein